MNCLWRRMRYPLQIIVFKPSIISRPLKTISCNKNINTFLTFSSLQQKNICLHSLRSKSKKAQHDSDDENDDDYTDDSSLTKDSRVVKFSTTSLRTDLILKSALGIARNKIEQQFYESKIRVNGKKIMKKSASVRIGDEIDIIKMISPKNPDHLYVSRVEILNVAVKEEAIAITARRFKNLLIENYETDPYKGQFNPETQ